MSEDKTGRALELQVASIYRDLGAKVQHNVELAGNQIDVYVILEIHGGVRYRIAVEVKDWTKPIGVDVVNKFAIIVNLLRSRGLIDTGVIVSAMGFSTQARNAAKAHGIWLLVPDDLKKPATPEAMGVEMSVPLEEKLLALGDWRRDAPVVCLGAVYMDLELRPVDIDELSARRQEEWTNVKSSLRIGGSAWYVYQYLDKLGCKTRLVTKIGDGSEELFAEGYIKPLRRALTPSAPKPQSGNEANHNHTAITVHLIQCKDPEGEEPIVTVMLTDTGVLKSICWDDDEIRQPISTLDGGMLYLSGYFKTALHLGLQEKLENLDRRKVIICLDHGRFRPDIVGAKQINPLRESIKYVDIYFCTTHEMKQLFRATLAEDPKLMEYGSLENVLKFLDKQLGPQLPEVILVRDNKGQENERLIAKVRSGHKHVFVSIPVHRIQAKPERFVGISNVFHARFMHCMLNDARCENLTPAIIEWALRAQRMAEWIMSHDDPTTFDQELAKFAQDCDDCEICAQWTQASLEEQKDNRIQLRPFNCLTTPGGEYAST